MHYPRRIHVGLLAVALLCAETAFSQAVDGTIVGTVYDATGGFVANAVVTLTETNTKIVHTGRANETGMYSFPELPPGVYDVAVSMTGFKKAVKTGVVLEANTSPRADLTLEPGQVNQQWKSARVHPFFRPNVPIRGVPSVRGSSKRCLWA